MCRVRKQETLKFPLLLLAILYVVQSNNHGDFNPLNVPVNEWEMEEWIGKNMGRLGGFAGSNELTEATTSSWP